MPELTGEDAWGASDDESQEFRLQPLSAQERESQKRQLAASAYAKAIALKEQQQIQHKDRSSDDKASSSSTTTSISAFNSAMPFGTPATIASTTSSSSRPLSWLRHGQATTTSTKHSSSSGSSRIDSKAATAVPTLHACCLAVLGQHLLEFLVAAQEQGGLAWLPPEVKASLLAVAR